jgi:hypothetical protein
MHSSVGLDRLSRLDKAEMHISVGLDNLVARLDKGWLLFFPQRGRMESLC